MNGRELTKRLSERGSVPGLGAIGALMDVLGHPEESIPLIHIAGTNGKGSVSAYLGQILSCAGYRVGRYVSPTIVCYEERFQVNGTFISSEEMSVLYDEVWQAIRHVEEHTEHRPTIFEAETAAAFLYFKKKQTDYAIIECGMGGRLDATNIIKRPVLSVITSISLDHMQFLGSSLEAIAAEKAGIIKSGVPCVLSVNPREVRDTVKEIAEEKHVKMYDTSEYPYTIIEESFRGSHFRVNVPGRLIISNVSDVKEMEAATNLPGRHQVENAVTAMIAALTLKKGIPEQTICEGIRTTRWPGRLELIGENPLVFRDGAHNPDAACRLAEFLQKYFTNRRVFFIMGVLRDKEYGKMLDVLMPIASRTFTFTPNNARGLDADILAQAVREHGIETVVCREVNEACRMARKEAHREDVLVVCGSLSFMEEMDIPIEKMNVSMEKADVPSKRDPFL